MSPAAGVTITMDRPKTWLDTQLVPMFSSLSVFLQDLLKFIVQSFCIKVFSPSSTVLDWGFFGSHKAV